MRFLRAGLAAVFLLVHTAAVATAKGDEPPATIELRGSRDAHVDVRFTERVTIMCCPADVSKDGTRIIFPDIDVRTDGTYAGYLIERLSDGKFVVGGVRIPKMDFGRSLPMVVPLTNQGGGALQPGDYRIHLLTDGESTVRFAVGGLEKDRTYRPGDRTRAMGSLEDLALVPGAPVSLKKIPATIRRGTLVMLASRVYTLAGQVNYLDQCMGQFADVCQLRGDDSWVLFVTPGAIASGIAMASLYPPGEIGPGQWHATFSAASVGIVEEAHTFVLTVR